MATVKKSQKTSSSSKSKIKIPEIKKTNAIAFVCCGRPMRVYWTKQITGAVMRQRICDICGGRRETAEQ